MSRDRKNVAPTATEGAAPTATEGAALAFCNLKALQYISSVELFSRKDMLYVVCFTASWCGPCKKIKPVIHQLQEEHADRVLFLFVDVDTAEDLVDSFKVEAMPTFTFFRRGVLLTSFKGADPEKLTETVALLKRTAYLV